MQPPIMEAYHAGNNTIYVRNNKIMYAITFWISASVSVLLFLVAHPLIAFLYGKDYLPAADPLKVITWYTAFSYLGVARNAWIVCENKQKYLIWIYAAAAVVNVLLNLCLIPIWGTVGAALASLMAQIITALVMPFFIRPLRPNAVMMLEAVCFKGLK